MIYGGVGRDWAKAPENGRKVLLVRDESTDIREGETGPAFDDMAALWVCLDAVRVDPGQGCGQQAEIEVVRDRIGGTGLAAGTADLLIWMPPCVQDDI